MGGVSHSAVVPARPQQPYDYKYLFSHSRSMHIDYQSEARSREANSCLEDAQLLTVHDTILISIRFETSAQFLTLNHPIIALAGSPGIVISLMRNYLSPVPQLLLHSVPLLFFVVVRPGPEFSSYEPVVPYETCRCHPS